jgi:hypothetical protein
VRVSLTILIVSVARRPDEIAPPAPICSAHVSILSSHADSAVGSEVWYVYA